MSFNGSGTFVINSTGQPVVTGTVISASTFNSLTADLGTGLSTTVTKDGQTTTTAKIPFALGLSAAAASNFAAGTVGLPAIYLSTDTTTGLYRIGANNDGFAVSGAKVLDIASTGLGITGTLKLAGATSGTTTVIATDAVTATITLPSATATLATLGTPSFTTGIGVGAATAGAGGVAFPATAVAVANVNTLDDYDEYTSTSTASSGALTTAIVYKLTKVGNLVTLTVPVISGTTAAASSIDLGVLMPAKYRPTAQILQAGPLIVNSSAYQSAPGFWNVNSNGAISIYRDGTLATNWSAGVTGGTLGTVTISWTI